MSITPSDRMKLKVAFSVLKNKVLASCSEAITDTCEEIYENAYHGTPVDTRNLQRSLTVNTPEYNVQFGDNEVYGEVHYGEPGHVGGWDNTEAYTYMWFPGTSERNWYGEILFRPWRKFKGDVVSKIRSSLRSKL